MENPFAIQQPYRQPISNEYQYPANISYNTPPPSGFGSVDKVDEYYNAPQPLGHAQIVPQYPMDYTYPAVGVESQFAPNSNENSNLAPSSIPSNEQTLHMPTISAAYTSDLSPYSSLSTPESSYEVETETPQSVSSGATYYASSPDSSGEPDQSGGYSTGWREESQSSNGLPFSKGPNNDNFLGVNRGWPMSKRDWEGTGRGER